jgi:hypothetical protein
VISSLPSFMPVIETTICPTNLLILIAAILHFLVRFVDLVRQLIQ